LSKFAIVGIGSIGTIAFGLSDHACNRFVSLPFLESPQRKRCGTSITPCGKHGSIAIQTPFRFGTLWFGLNETTFARFQLRA
jgi:hypothetical protein